MVCGLKYSASRTFSRATYCSEAMSSVITDCDGVPGQQSRCTLYKQPLRGYTQSSWTVEKSVTAVSSSY